MHTLRATKQISEPFLQIIPRTLQTHGQVDLSLLMLFKGTLRSHECHFPHPNCGGLYAKSSQNPLKYLELVLTISEAAPLPSHQC